MADAEELEMLRDSVRGFIADRRTVHVSSQDDAVVKQGEPWSEIVEAGWLLAGIDETLGGFGAGFDGAAVVLEEIGRGLLTAPVMPTMVALQLLVALPPSDARDDLIAQILAGRRVAFAYGETGTRHEAAYSVSVRSEADGIIADGCKTIVLGLPGAELLIVAAQASDGAAALIAVPVDAPGVETHCYRLIGGAAGGDLALRGVALPSDAVLASGDAVLAAVDHALDFGAVAACCTALGAMRALFDLTLAYLKDREQFGRPIGANQALQHRMVDALRAIEEVAAANSEAVEALAADPAQRRRAASAAKVLAGDAARLIGQEAVQLHGAIGTTDESIVSHYFRQLIALRVLYGDPEHHVARYAANLGEADAAADRLTAQLSDEDRAFSVALRSFIEAELDAVTRDITAAGGTPPQSQRLAWEQALGRKGWLAYTWSRADGGPGLSTLQQFLFEQITAEMNAPRLPLFATKMVGPVLNAFGTEAQKRQHLPGILSGEVAWCQGYSEPGAGSDLAALKTAAVADGDDYVLNGQKIWTTGAHYADFIFVLARTSQEPKRQQGISFFLVDMRSPGITVRPIMSAYGSHTFNQVFFDNVRVPQTNLVGDEGSGWTYAKYLLSHERLGVLGSLGLRQAMTRARQAANRTDADGRSLRDDPAFLGRLARLEIRLAALNMWVGQIVQDMVASGAPGPLVSLLMMSATQLAQDIAAFTMDALGPDALPFAFARAGAPERRRAPSEPFEATATANYIYQRVFTILGGTTEIQKNIVAKTVLGLPG